MKKKQKKEGSHFGKLETLHLTRTPQLRASATIRHHPREKLWAAEATISVLEMLDVSQK